MVVLLPESNNQFWMKSHSPLRPGLLVWLSLGIWDSLSQQRNWRSQNHLDVQRNRFPHMKSQVHGLWHGNISDTSGETLPYLLVRVQYLCNDVTTELYCTSLVAIVYILKQGSANSKVCRPLFKTNHSWTSLPFKPSKLFCDCALTFSPFQLSLIENESELQQH